MNTKYIDIDVLEKMVVDSKNNNPHSNSIHRQMHTHEHQHFLCMIASLPIADVAEVRHGEWIRELIRNEKGGCVGANMICSCCEQPSRHDEFMKYCPNCGAQMKGNIEV